jgi:SAM-dependent methyltransferase
MCVPMSNLPTTAGAILQPGCRSEHAPRAFHIVHLRPPGYAHAEALTEFAECVYFGLRRLGIPVFYLEQPDRPARQIVFGAHTVGPAEIAALPADAILYNSEQVDPNSDWLHGSYMGALRERSVWDYSAANVQRLTALGARSVQHVPLGYVPELARIPFGAEDVDVLFYGSVNPRRHKVLDALRARGLNVVALFGAYGEERDRAISRAKVVLSMHFYEAKVFEIVRVAYLLTNSKAVVAECDFQTSEESELRDALYGVPYESLVETCVQLVNDPAERLALRERAHRIFSRRREEDLLVTSREICASLESTALSRTPVTATLPATLQIGSGKDFRPDCLNIDISAAWGPDAVLDIAASTLIGTCVETARFGKITLTEGLFEGAVAIDVLEHIADLPTAMTNILRLLKPGGVFDILVPYDLSLGAWQDPTHVRAFNERSWLYYTDWHWYLGWTEARFDVENIELHMSPFGVELQRAGKTHEEILRTPRAVDALRVRLRKRFLQQSERREALLRQPGARVTAQPGPRPA